MRDKLRCKLFGHSFIAKRDDGDMKRTFMVSFCVKCGLSKEELGIGVIKNELEDPF